MFKNAAVVPSTGTCLLLPSSTALSSPKIRGATMLMPAVRRRAAASPRVKSLGVAPIKVAGMFEAVSERPGITIIKFVPREENWSVI